ncbi:hypothetical protein FQA39_LY15398 [Lamprigera yunnana]|nr:hypothetical protein FQA39_LY15398 [Lamprigera yunnana]
MELSDWSKERVTNMWALLVGILLLLIFYLKIVKIYNYWHEREIPYVKPLHYVFGNLTPALFRIKSFPKLIEDAYESFPNNRYVGFYQFTTPTLIIRDPELIKDITIKDFDSFPNHRQFIPASVDPLWGKNLFQMSTEDGWHGMRAILSPSFTGSKMKILFNLMEECAAQFMDYFKSYNGEVDVEIKDTFTRFANDIIGTCAFGIQCNSLKHRDNEFYMMGKEATDFSGFKSLKFFGYGFNSTLIKFFNVKVFSKKVSTFFRSTIEDTIELRRQKNVVRPDMIHLLLEAAKKMKNANTEEKRETFFNELSDEHIISSAINFLVAGFESVSTALSYLTYDLAVNPDVQKRLYDEINETLEPSQKTTYQSIMSMKYLDCVTSESLRIHSPVVVMDRKCVKPYTIKPVSPTEKPLHVDPGTIIWVPITAFHKDEKYFPNPKKFDPERFSDENKPNINPFAYFPFGSGPRNCIGSRFALLEIKMITVEILKNFEIITNAQTEIPLKHSPIHFNGIPSTGIWVTFKPRI